MIKTGKGKPLHFSTKGLCFRSIVPYLGLVEIFSGVRC